MKNRLPPGKALTALTVVGTLLVGFLATASNAQSNVTPAQYLASQPKPNFAPGNTLPPLTRFGWAYGPNTNTMIELASNWGYTLVVDVLNGRLSDIFDSSKDAYTYVQLVKSNPSKFKLMAIINSVFPTPVPDSAWVTNTNGWFVDLNSNVWQSATNTQFLKVISPEGPDSFWSNAAAYWVSDLKVIQSNVPISMVLSDGEYGLAEAATGNAAWKFDPRVQAATNGLTWPRYATIRKARQLGFVTAAIKQALPNRQLNIYYSTGSESSRITPNWQDWWGFDSDLMVTNSDLPSFESYYFDWAGANFSNSSSYDLLTKYLNSVGTNIALGYPLNYSWVTGGSYQDMSTHAPARIYMGFLKCLYTGGMVGANAGYYGIPTNGWEVTFPSDSPPDWIVQIQSLAHVHAMFSHLESYLRNGDLLPGPNHHAMSQDQPAYEFPTGFSNDRVLARKLRSANQWLITAWAADGTNHNVTVTLPVLGSVQVLARDCGTIYLANMTNLALLDANGMLPTASFSASLSPPPNLHVISGSTN